MPRVDKTGRYERHRIVNPSVCIPGRYGTQDIGKTGFSKRIGCVNINTGKWITQSLLISHDEPENMKRMLRKKANEMRARARKAGMPTD